MQSAQTTTSLRIGYMIVLGVPMILAGVFVYFFPITHQRAMENRRLLDERVAACVVRGQVVEEREERGGELVRERLLARVDEMLDALAHERGQQRLR
jgi:hypothetical protein